MWAAGCVLSCDLNGGNRALCGWMQLCVFAAYLEYLCVFVRVLGCINAQCSHRVIVSF